MKFSPAEATMFTFLTFHFKMWLWIKRFLCRQPAWYMVFIGGGCKLDPERIKQLVESSDEASFKELFEHFHGKTYAAVMALVRHRQWAEDLTQEAFIRAYRRLDTLREPTKFGPWVAMIATNLARDALKRETKYVLTSDPLAGKSNAPEVSVEEQVLRNESSAWIREALEELTHDQYQVIILFYYYDQKVEDIARIMGTTPGTIKSRLHRARRKLSESLQSYEWTEDSEEHSEKQSGEELGEDSVKNMKEEPNKGLKSPMGKESL